MDYEKAYKEALNRAKLLKYNPQKVLFECENIPVSDYIFPELKESKSERIKKVLVDYFKRYKGQEERGGSTMFCGIPTDDILEWFEKQGNKDKLIQELGEYKVKYTQEVLEQHINSMGNKDDERLRKTTIAFLKDFAEQGYENAVECIDWLEKQDEKKIAWSEEDENGLGDALWAIKQARTIAKNENEMGGLWYAERWLKSLKDRIQSRQNEEPQGKTALEAITEETVDNANKVEPKFKVGDWVVKKRWQKFL